MARTRRGRLITINKWCTLKRCCRYLSLTFSISLNDVVLACGTDGGRQSERGGIAAIDCVQRTTGNVLSRRHCDWLEPFNKLQNDTANQMVQLPMFKQMVQFLMQQYIEEFEGFFVDLDQFMSTNPRMPKLLRLQKLLEGILPLIRSERVD